MIEWRFDVLEPMRVLTLNAGSSSLKFRVFEVTDGAQAHTPPKTIAAGAIENIGGEAIFNSHETLSGTSLQRQEVSDHAHATRWALKWLERTVCATQGPGAFAKMIDAVGHRVVHGGDLFSQSVRMSSEVVNEIERWNDLAPLHNPASLAAIREAIVFFGDAMPMVAAFDTAFYRGMPRRAQMYAIPAEFAEKHHIQRYGFHGIAHASLAAGYAKVSGRPLDTSRIITLHLGNGCSATAVSGGKALDTSMGFTPLEGLIMGTRSGDCDPSIVGYLADKEQVSHKEVERWLNEQSGLLGISGISNQMDVLLEAATADRESPAELAIDMFCYRIRKYVGAYLGALGGADVIVFGGGIGERAPEIRARVCSGMDWCGLRLDERRNRSAVELAPGEGRCISRDDARLNAYVVAADEEAYIASETVRCVQAG